MSARKRIDRSPVSRRKFLRTAGTAAAGASIAVAGGSWLSPAAAEERDQRRNTHQKDPVDKQAYAQAFRFLTAATFGPTPEDVAAVLAAGSATAWIQQQIQAPRTNVIDYMAAVSINDRHVLQGYRGLRNGGANKPDHYAVTTAGDPCPDDEPGGNYCTYEELMGHDSSYKSIVNRNATSVLYDVAMHAPDQLRQRTTHALSQIFVISEHDPTLEHRGYARVGYWDMLSTHAFGTFRALLESIVRSPAMGIYLSHRGNEKANGATLPDENMARELLQLFTIGLHNLNIDGTVDISLGYATPTYNNDDVKTIARILTGLWDSARHDGGPGGIPEFGEHPGDDTANPYWELPSHRADMKFFGTAHDGDEKTWQVFNHVAHPQGINPNADLSLLLDRLATHPNTAPFVSKRLIQNLTTSNPSKGYVAHVAHIFRTSGGDLGRVVEAILTYEDFETPMDAATFGKTRDPLIRQVAFMRAVGFTNGYPLVKYPGDSVPKIDAAAFRAGAHRTFYGDAIGEDLMITKPLGAPDVFGYFPPTYRPDTMAFAGKTFENQLLVAPETHVYSGSPMIRSVNLASGLVFATTPTPTAKFTSSVFPTHGNYPYQDRQNITLNMTQFENLSADSTALLDHVDQLLFGYGMSSATRTTIETALNNSQLNDPMKARLAVMGALASPEYAVQR